jgi:nitrite reductase/ring-hydroxylating ferredoxin subunit
MGKSVANPGVADLTPDDDLLTGSPNRPHAVAYCAQRSSVRNKHVSPAERLMLVPVRPLSDLAPGDAVRLEPEHTLEPSGPGVAVFRTEDGLHAVDDSCTHQDTALSDGYLEGCFVECPLHAALFDLRTGVPDGPPARTPVRVHPVVVIDGMIHVELPEVAALPAEVADAAEVAA